MTEFLRNCWYAAAWNHEVGPEPMARTFLDEPVVLYRTGDGTSVALEDRCCHRSLPLSLGRVMGDNLQCGYHGLTYAPDGACVEVPGQSLVPPGAGGGSASQRMLFSTVSAWATPHASSSANSAMGAMASWWTA